MEHQSSKTRENFSDRPDDGQLTLEDINDRLVRMETRMSKFMEAFGIDPTTGKMSRHVDRQLYIPKYYPNHPTNQRNNDGY